MKAGRLLVLALLGLLLGLGIAVYRISHFEGSKAFFRNGNWMGTNNLPLGKDKLLTTQVTLFALYALPSEEAVYLFARRDNDNELLTAANSYTIQGNINDISARYWSITMYGKDLFLVPNKAGRYSFNNTNLITDSLGNFTITISSAPQAGNWLPAPPKGRFNLLLRLYMGQPHFLRQLHKARLPVITKSKPL